MNILYDFDIFTRQRFGGISRYFYELISGISKANKIYLDIYLGLNNSGYDFSLLGKNVNVKGQRIRAADKIHFLLNPLNKYFFEKYLNLSKNNIFHRTYYNNYTMGSRIKNIVTIHDMTHELLPEYFAKSDNTRVVKKKSIEQSNGIICVSDTTKNDLLNLYDVRDKEIRVIYHGIGFNLVNGNLVFFDRPYILYVAQRWGYKNFNKLLTAYNLCSKFKDNFNIVCFGGGEFNFSEKLYIGRNNLENKVLHISGTDSVLFSLYKNALACVYTSLYEGFGFPPLEAMKCGCPVLASKAGSVMEIAGDAALYFEPNNIDDLINKLDLLLNDTRLKDELIKKGYSRAELFTWDKSVTEHLEFYKSF